MAWTPTLTTNPQQPANNLAALLKNPFPAPKANPIVTNIKTSTPAVSGKIPAANSLSGIISNTLQGTYGTIGQGAHDIAKSFTDEAGSVGQTVLAGVGRVAKAVGLPEPIVKLYSGAAPTNKYPTLVQQYKTGVEQQKAANAADPNAIPGFAISGNSPLHSQVNPYVASGAGVALGVASLYPGFGAEENAVKAIVLAKNAEHAASIASKLGIAEKYTAPATEAFIKASTPKEAAAALKKYTTLSKIDEHQTMVGVMKDSVDNHPAKGLLKYYGNRSPDDHTLAEILSQSEGTGNKSRRLDDIASEHGFFDLNDAQNGLDHYRQMRSQLQESQNTLKDMQAKAAMEEKRALQTQGGPRKPSASTLRVPPLPSAVERSAQTVPEVKASLPRSLAQDFNPDKYVEEQTAAREAATKVGQGGIMAKTKSFLANAKAKLVDFTAPIEDTLRAAEKKSGIKLLPSQDIHNQIDRVLRAPTLAGQFAKDNGIVDVLRKVDNPDALDQYLIAKHASELDARGIKTGRDLAKDEALVKAYGSKYEPYAKTVAQYSQKLLDYSANSGLISRDLAAKLKEMYPDYVPFNRVFPDSDFAGSGAGGKEVASLSRQTAVQRIKGSEREIESPIQSLLAKTNDVFKQGEKNKAAKMLLSYRNLPDNPFQIQEIKPKMVPVATITHKEQVFPEVMNRISYIVQKYGGTIDRKLKTGKVFGKFEPGKNAITTKFGTSKDTLLHEFGHMLDSKFGLRSSDFFDKATNVELRNVADLRGRSTYTRQGDEKIAEFVSMYFSDFKNVQRVAPVTTRKFTQFLVDKPELKDLVDTMKSRVRSQESMDETIFRPSVFEPKEPHFTAFINGEKKYFATTPEVANAAKALNVQQLGIIGRILTVPVRVARLGITGINLPFVASNIAKDQITAFINSSNALRTSAANPSVFLHSLYSAVGHDKLYQEMVRAGGAGTSYDIARNQVENTVASIRAGRNVASKALYTVRHPSELLRAVENIVGRSEEFTRVQQYAGTKQALLKQGLPEHEAVIGAARAARDNTVNFARRGEWGTVLNSAFLYLNASIQGTRTLLGSLRDKPIQTAAKIAISALFPMATITAWNLSDPKRKAAYDDIPEFEKQNNMVIVPDNPTKDSQGRWNVIKIPLSQEINNLVGIARRGIEATHGENPLAFNDFAQALLGTVSPINPTSGSIFSTLTPQALKPSIEGAVNQNLFTGKPEVPASLDKLSPQNQVQPYTSGTARIIGDKLNLSPIKVEAWIKETFGGLGPQALNVIDQVLAKTGKIPASQIGGQNILDAITARFNKAQGGQGDQAAIKDLQNTLQKQADAANSLKLKAEDLDKQLATLSPAEANAKVSALSKSDPKLVAELEKVVTARKLNYSYEEKLMQQLGVTNGERAKYIDGQIMKLPDSAARNAYLNQLIQKKLVSPQVLDQLKQLRAAPASQPATTSPSGATSFLDKAFGVKTAQASELPSVYIRDNEIKPTDLSEARAVLFGEISNRNPEKQALEAQTILNTAFNRMDEYRKHGTPKTLMEVLQMPNQYQAYKGKEYTRYKSGKTGLGDKQKEEAIDKVLAQVRDGTFQNNIGNSVSYTHAKDGRIIVNNKQLFKNEELAKK